MAPIGHKAVAEPDQDVVPGVLRVLLEVLAHGVLGAQGPRLREAARALPGHGETFKTIKRQN